MGKRGNENSQLSKEDYEAAEKQSETSDVTGGTFQRAAEEEINQRRIIRANRTAFTATTTEKQSPVAGTGVFAGINLTAGTTNTGFSFSSFTSAPAPSTTTTTSTGFSFGISAGDKAITTTTTTNTTAVAPSSASNGFSFGATDKATTTTGFSFGTKAPTPAAATATTTTATTTATSEMERLEQKREKEMFDDWEVFKKSNHIHEKERLIHKMCSNIRSWKKKLFDAEPTSTTTAASSSTVPSTTTASSITTALTKPPSTTPTAPVPASSTNTFAFGAGTTKMTPSNALPPSVAAPIAASTTGTFLSPPSTDDVPNDGGPSDDIPKNQGAVVMEVADPDWNDIASFEPVTIWRSDNGSYVPVVKKTRLRLQTSKTDASRHRMLGRDMMGIPKVNMIISTGMQFTFSEEAKKRGPIGKVLFVGVNDAEKGHEKFIVQAQVMEGKRLHEKLEQLAT